MTANAPLECILEAIQSKTKSSNQLLRTYRARLVSDIKSSPAPVEYINSPVEKDVRFAQTAAPSYEGLRLDEYISVTEMLNPVYRLWSDGRWNKMILAHGCYWAKCTFCDTSLDYIKRYEPDRVENIITKLDAVAKETGQTGFHFVDEAAPPAVLKAMSLKLIELRRTYTWWGEYSF